MITVISGVTVFVLVSSTLGLLTTTMTTATPGHTGRELTTDAVILTTRHGDSWLLIPLELGTARYTGYSTTSSRFHAPVMRNTGPGTACQLLPIFLFVFDGWFACKLGKEGQECVESKYLVHVVTTPAILG